MITKTIHVYIALAVAISGSLLYFFFSPTSSTFFPPCPFYSFTGWFCPGCGSQRAFHALLHGNILSSANYNLLFVVALPVVGYSALARIAAVVFGKKWNQQLFNSTTFAISILLLVITFWVLRNIAVVPFNWLAP